MTVDRVECCGSAYSPSRMEGCFHNEHRQAGEERHHDQDRGDCELHQHHLQNGSLEPESQPRARDDLHSHGHDRGQGPSGQLARSQQGLVLHRKKIVGAQRVWVGAREGALPPRTEKGVSRRDRQAMYSQRERIRRKSLVLTAPTLASGLLTELAHPAQAIFFVVNSMGEPQDFWTLDG